MVCIVTQVAQITHLVQDNTLCCIAYTEGVKLFHSGKFYTGQKKIYTGTACGAGDKYEI